MCEAKKIKCIVWDLDNTIWNGTLLEDHNVVLKMNIVEMIKALDERGILHSIASRNDYQIAMDKIKEFGIEEYFLYPQINWGSKAAAVKKIAESINIGLDSLAFVDDQLFELEEVKDSYPEVLCINASETGGILAMPGMMPKFFTADSKMRRTMYLNDIKRNELEADFAGPKASFLSSLHMVFSITEATEEDLKRAEELTVRTHQLNTTGYTYSYEELDQFRKSANHRLYICGLEDKYGTYGKIGLVLVEVKDSAWIIKLLLMSCRVMTRGVGNVLITWMIQEAIRNKTRLLAEFIPTDRNRMMYMTYKFMRFNEKEKMDHVTVLENDLSYMPKFPDYIKINDFRVS
jgi:FkbH-like protein